MELPKNDDAFKEVLSWQAHRAPVLSLLITAYGTVIIPLSILFLLFLWILDCTVRIEIENKKVSFDRRPVVGFGGWCY